MKKIDKENLFKLLKDLVDVVDPENEDIVHMDGLYERVIDHIVILRKELKLNE